MALSQAPCCLSGCGLPDAWQHQTLWCVLDTDFGDASAFFATWQAWAAQFGRVGVMPRLHYVAIAAQAPLIDTLLHLLAAFPALAAESPDLAQQWFGLLPGFHRISLQGGQVQLTLCIGGLQPLLREHRFVADSVFLRGLEQPTVRGLWDRWTVKALARLCRRGTGISVSAADTRLRSDMAEAGFILPDQPEAAIPASGTPGAAAALWPGGRYQPQWEPGTSRQPWRSTAAAPSHCVVVGAGLAGATVAAALARRGWRVTVLDQAAQPAAAASGLPVGLVLPQISQDDSIRSRLSRAGVRLTIGWCRALLTHGEDWALSGVLALHREGASGLPANWPPAGREWSDNAPQEVIHGAWSDRLAGANGAIWHAAAAWIKPAQLVRACLATNGVLFQGRSEVFSIVRVAEEWVLRDANGKLLAQAPQLVLAGAGQSVRLLDTLHVGRAAQPANLARLASMAGVAGQVSWGKQCDACGDVFPPFPVNGLGSLVANVPVDGARAWFAGATYTTGPCAAADVAAGHRENLARIGQLLPGPAKLMQQQFARGQLQAWHGTRCTTPDRLPAVGPLDAAPKPSLWISAGMGSRGLTYAALCAEVLAAQLGGEPSPLPASLLKTISATRRRLR